MKKIEKKMKKLKKIEKNWKELKQIENKIEKNEKKILKIKWNDSPVIVCADGVAPETFKESQRLIAAGVFTDETVLFDRPISHRVDVVQTLAEWNLIATSWWSG